MTRESGGADGERAKGTGMRELDRHKPRVAAIRVRAQHRCNERTDPKTRRKGVTDQGRGRLRDTPARPQPFKVGAAEDE